MHYVIAMRLCIFFMLIACIMTQQVNRVETRHQRRKSIKNRQRKPPVSPTERLDELLHGATLRYVRHKGLNTHQTETQRSLRDQLGKLVRRTRWIPPVPCTNCRSGYSLYSSSRNYGPNQVLYLQRYVAGLNTEVEKMRTSVDSVIRWKSESERKIQELEMQQERMNQIITEHSHSATIASQPSNNFDQSRQVQSLQTMVLELQRSVTELQQSQGDRRATEPSPPVDTAHGEASAGTNSTLSSHEARLNQHDEEIRRSAVGITSLQHHLVRLLSKSSKQDRKISLLQSIITNSSTPRAQLPTYEHSESVMDGGPSVESIRRTSQRHGQEIKGLTLKVAEMQTCCRNVAALSLRMDATNTQVVEVRERMVESGAAMRLQEAKMNEMVTKLDRQRIIIQRLQESVRNQHRSISLMNRNIRDSLKLRVKRINQTIFANLTSYIQSFESRARDTWNSISMDLENTNHSMEAINQYLNQLSEQSNENNQILEDLERIFPQHISQAGDNITFIAQRLSSNERTLIGIMLRLDEMQVATQRHQSEVAKRIKSSEAKIDFIENGVLQQPEPVDESSMEESIVFLNSSFHQIRSAVHRLSSRVDNINTAAHRLAATDRRSKVKLLRLQNLMKVQNEKWNNSTISLHRMVTSDANSLRHAVASRLATLRHQINNVTSTTTFLATQYDSISDEVQDANQLCMTSIGDLDAKTSAIIHNMTLDNKANKMLISNWGTDLNNLNKTLRGLINSKLQLISDECEENRAALNTRISMMHQNLSSVDSRLTGFQHSLGGARRSMEEAITNYDDVVKDVNSLKSDLNEYQRSQDLIQTRLATVDRTFTRHNERIQENLQKTEMNWDFISTVRSACGRDHNTSLQMIYSLEVGCDQVTHSVAADKEESNARFAAVSNKLVQMKNEVYDVLTNYNDRLVPLETLNGSFIRLIENCNDDLYLLHDSVKQLRSVDNDLLESISLHEHALVEHRQLHTNLSAISQDVSSVINEHEVALHSVRGIVVELNETVAEGEVRIEEEIDAQLQRHMREVASLHGIMRNFTSMLEIVLSNRVNQEISMASVRIHQRGLVERVNSHSSSIDRINHDASRVRSTINGVEAITGGNVRKINNLMSLFNGQKRDLRRLDRNTHELNDVTMQLNTSLSSQGRNINLIQNTLSNNRFLMTGIVDQLTGHENDFDRFKHTVSISMNNINENQQMFRDRIERHNNTLVYLDEWSSSAQSWMDDLYHNADLVDTRLEFLANALHSLPTLEHNVSSLATSVSETLRTSSENFQKMELLNNNLASIEQALTKSEADVRAERIAHNERHDRIMRGFSTLRTNCDATSVVVAGNSDSIRGIERGLETKETNWEMEITGLKEQLDIQASLVEASVMRVNQQRSGNQVILAKIVKQEKSVEELNSTLVRCESSLQMLESSSAEHSQALTTLQLNNAENDEVLQNLQSTSWNAASRLNEMSARINGVEDQLSYMEGKIRGSRVINGKQQVEIANLRHQLHGLDLNVSQINIEISMLMAEQRGLNRANSDLTSLVQSQDHVVRNINQTLSIPMNNQVLASILSSLSALEDTILYINETLFDEIVEMDDLLTDFQLAFDTSGHRMAKHGHELRILAANTSNYFSHFATTVDFLRMIVSETNEAVVENSERIRMINDSLLQLASFVITAPPSRGNLTGPPQTDLNMAWVDLRSTRPIGGLFNNGNILRSVTEDTSLVESNEPEYDEHYEDELIKGMTGEEVDYNVDTEDDYGSYGGDGEHDRVSILNGDADDARIERRMATLVNPSYVQDHEGEGYDYYTP